MKIYLLFIFLAYLSCSQKVKTIHPKHDVSFEEYVSKIDKIKLPLEGRCTKDLLGQRFNFDAEIISKYGIENSQIYGVLAEKKNYTAILYLQATDVSLPVIVTTNKKGKKIASLNLYEISCWQDEEIEEVSWFKINENLTIELGDSSTTFKRKGGKDIIESSRKSTVRYRTFEIDIKGNIIPL